MKSRTTFYLALLAILCALSLELRAQIPGQFIITSYERAEPFYFCGDKPMLGGQNVHFGIANLRYKDHKILDSLRFYGDTTIFLVSEYEPRDSVNPGEAYLSGVYYIPRKIGSDTLRIVGYYGPYKSTGTIICHAKPAPPLAFYGVMVVVDDVGGGFQIGGSDEVLTVDTLHDVFAYGPYEISDTPRRTGYVDAVYLYSCGTVTIDSIYTVGDFSELDIKEIPTVPYTMHSGDSVKMPYTFTPKVPGKHPHYLVLHTTTGEYLVWSFEYRVLEQMSVSREVLSNVALQIHPNPARGQVTVTLPEGDEARSVFVFDAAGTPVQSVTFAQADHLQGQIILDVSGIASGAYTVLATTDNRLISGKFVKY